jgi:1-acyl-sn-glycerol-3-phosphate acyltransferase
MGKGNIEKYSTRYALLKRTSGFWHDKIYYRKIIVMGTENIDPDAPVIYAPNHQNALMDALAVLYSHKGQPVFLARADIFKKKLTASLLYFLKILPVYRIRDGFSTLKSNDEIFLKTIDVLKNKNGLVILPEGDHAGFRRLRQLKKGICRVAFQAEEATDFNLNIKIIPVGIDYSNYTRFRQVLTLIYGEPIEVSEFHQLYRETPEIALNELRNRISIELKKVMIHIDTIEDYEAIDELRSIINGKFSDNINPPKIYKDRELIDKLNNLRSSDLTSYRKICSLSLEIKKKSEVLGLGYRLLEKKKHPLFWLLAGSAGLLITLPVWIFGNIFTLTFLALPDIQLSKIKDPQFHSSIRFVLSLALAFVFMPVYLILCLFIFSPWWLAIVIFLTIPMAGLFAWNYNLVFRRIKGGFRLRRLIRKNNPACMALRKDYDNLITLVSGLSDEKI